MSIPAVVNMSNLKRQLRFFEKNKDAILKKYGEAFVVVSSDLEVKAFDSEYDAYVFGRDHYGLGNFLLKDCRAHSLNQVYIVSPTIALA